MSSHATEVVVGGVVLATAVGFLVYASQFADVSATGVDDYPLTASFRSAEGVGVGTDVRLAGVKVGTVTGLDLNAETFRAVATLTIRNGLALPEDTAAIIASEGLLGGNFVELLPGGSAFNFEPGDEIFDTEGSVSLVSLLLRFVTGGEGTE